jgi:integrase
MKGNPINTSRKQRALTPRKEPYWHAFRRGASIGIYVGAASRTWVARAKDPKGVYRFSTLGTLDDFSYEEAETRARAFADQVGRAERPDYRVRDAIADYARDSATRKGAQRAAANVSRLMHHMTDELAQCRLSRLRSNDISAWRDGMVLASDDPEGVRRSRDSANRVLAVLRAALNLAFRSGHVASDAEWRRVQQFADVDAPRTLFLEPEQVQALIDATSGGFKALVRAAVLTGARYGELAAALVRDFDAQHGTLALRGKTGSRIAHLSGAAVEFFRTLAQDKPLDAFLLTRDDGLPWRKSNQCRLMKDAVKAAGLPAETVFYSLRHYHISRALLAGVNVQVLAENCGTSVRMIETHYGKFTNADRRAMLDRVEL